MCLSEADMSIFGDVELLTTRYECVLSRVSKNNQVTIWKLTMPHNPEKAVSTVLAFGHAEPTTSGQYVAVSPPR